MRSDAHIDIVTLLIEGDHCIFRQIIDMLDFIDLSAFFHQSDRLIAGKRINLEWKVLLYDLLHLFLDLRKIIVA